MKKKYGELEIVSEEYIKKMEDRKKNQKEEYEEEKEDIKYPIYVECFKNALSSILIHLDRINDKCEKEYRDEEHYRYSISRLPDNADNIYAFLGGRGTGKTTAINEFGKSLKHINKIKTKREWIKEVEDSLDSKIYDRKLEFIVLDTIDASLLSDKEDFVELVLAQLFSMIEDERMHSAVYSKRQNSHNVAELMDAFYVAYTSYHNISGAETEKDLGESVAHILKNMPSGSNARWAIFQLLKKFLDFIGEGEKAERYLVIIIDDLDLNINYAYKLLEQIHKYLSDPRIIVLIAADFIQLAHVCEAYMKKQYAKNAEDEGLDNAIALSKAYLLKAIPLSNRIYMPDSREFVKKYVRVEGNENAIRDIKSFIMNKIVEKLGIYYDMNGTKQHFAIPETVRELVNYNDFLDSLDSFVWDEKKLSEEQMNQYDRNHAEMKQDIVNRMAYQLLSYKQLKVFRILVEKNILNRGRYAVDLCNNWMEKKNEERIDDRQYHYADLLEGIYKLGRCDYCDKALVHCLIAFFTSEMTREYYNAQCDNETVARSSRKPLENFLGESFGNKWLAEMVPQATFDKKTGVVGIWGYVEKAQIDVWQLRNSLEVKGEQGYLHEKEVFDQLINTMKTDRCFEILGMFMMFFSEYRISGAHVSVPEIKFEISELFDFEYHISFDANTVTFDTFGFIGKEWDEEQIEKITNGIVDKIIKGVERFVNKREVIREQERSNRTIRSKLKKIVKDQMEKWICGNFMSFPYYSLDMSYNVLKRARKRGCHVEGIIQLNQIYDTMKRIYGYIATELYLEDQAYEDNKIKGRHWYDSFVQCPFIQNFGISYSEETINRYPKLENIDGRMSEEMKRELEKMIKALQAPVIKDDTPN